MCLNGARVSALPSALSACSAYLVFAGNPGETSLKLCRVGFHNSAEAAEERSEFSEGSPSPLS